jgi:hypothetical protein
MALNKIQFQTNVPVEVALKFAEGKLCDSQFGAPQYMFTTADDRVFFVAEKVAQKIHGLRLAPGECFDICKAEVAYTGGRKGIEWQVGRVGSPEPPAPQEKAPEASVAAPAPASVQQTPKSVASTTNSSSTTNGNGHANGNGNGHAASEPSHLHLGWAQFLLTQTEALIDVYAAASSYASAKYGNSVKSDDVRSLMLSAFINISKGGGVNVA